MIYQTDVNYTPEYLREHGFPELKELLIAAKATLAQLQISNDGVSHIILHTHLFSKIRKDIARILTILKELS